MIFVQVFEDRELSFEMMVLQLFKVFLVIEEKCLEVGSDVVVNGKKKELMVMGGMSFDDVVSVMMQRFLKDIS